MRWSLADAAAAMQGSLTGADAQFGGVSTDTRSIEQGNLFVALKGPNFDGADYLDIALDKGAAGAVVSERRDSALPQIEVDDTLRALGRLGAAWRDRHEALTVVGITGSNGKTTLKEMTYAILSEMGPTLATAGNLNNEIGVPLMLSRLSDEYRYAVIEMGANHAGEIGYLTSLVKPDVVALTNAGPAHLEGFGSIEGVSRAKGEILSGTPRPRAAALNADDQYFEYWQGLTSDIRTLSFGLTETATAHPRDIELGSTGLSFTLCLPDGEARTSIRLTGEHNVLNACAAAAIAHALDVPVETIARGLANVNSVGGRLNELAGHKGARLFDDSYNANPSSVAAAAAFLASLDGQSCLVLGDMSELGDDEVEMHRATGKSIRDAGVGRLLATGPLSKSAVEGFGDGAQWFENLDDLKAAAENLLGPDTNLLVKGSRVAAMERVVAALAANGESATGRAH